jgi:acyl-CoA synthetase (AMP-forming)/AMP-acid ligase II/thioesterase domain-containing protein/acyl carrier protein
MTSAELQARSQEELCIYGPVSARARQAPDAIVILAPGRRPLTYGGLLAQIEYVVRALSEMGVERQDRVAVVLPNSPEAAVAYVAVASGATFAPLDPACQAREFDRRLSDLNAKALIVQAGTGSAAREAARTRGTPLIELSPLASAEAGRFELKGASGASRWSVAFAGPTDDAVALYTSGTTDRPRLVPLTHASVCLSAQAIADSLELTAEDRCLNVLPPFHGHGLDAGMLASLAAGGSIVCTPGFDAGRFFEWMRELRPTWYSAAPAVHRGTLAAAASNKEAIRHSRLRFIRSSSSMLPSGLKEEMERTFGVPVIECYGMTEVGPITSERLPPHARKPGSAGTAIGTEVAIMNAAGDRLRTGQMGEIVVRGPTVMRGYENDPAANRAAFVNGWLRTGDQGFLDREGYLFITGRLKEIIDRGGEKVSPQEVDGVLMEHPAIREAAAFPMPDRRLGEEVAAVVVLRPGASATEAELMRFAGARLADHKVPRRFIIRDDIPKGPGGKVQRAKLAEELGLAKVGTSQDQSPDQEQSGPTEFTVALSALWQEILDVPSVGLRDNFFELGGDSLGVARVLARVEDAFGVSIPPAVFYREPTVAGLAAALFGGLGTKPPPTLVPLQPNGSRRPLFLVTPGTAWFLFDLARHLGKDRPLYGLQSFEIVESESAGIRVEELAAHYLRCIRRVQLNGPYLIGGLSAGGVVAFEMAQQLLAQGQQVGALVMFDTPYSRMLLREGPFIGVSWWQFLVSRIGFLRARPAAPNRSTSGLARWLGKALSPLLGAPAEAQGSASRHADELRARFRRVIMAHVRAVRDYQPLAYPGRITYFWAEDTHILGLRDPRRGWDRLARGGVTVHKVPGQHHQCLKEPHVQVLAPCLRKCLAEAEEAATRASSGSARHG